MVFWKNILLLSLCILSVVDGRSERPLNLPCKLDDIKCLTDMTQWAYSVAIEGDAEKGIESIDPMYQEQIEGNLGYVNYTIKKTTFEGLKRCKVVNAGFGSDITSQHIRLICPHFHMDGQYDVDGKLLSYPIRGKGDYYVDITNYHLSLDTSIVFYKKDDDLFIKHKSFTIDAVLMGLLDLELKNLFDGNKKLSNNIHKFAKENPRLFANLIQDPIYKSNIKKFMKNFNKLFKEIPIKVLLQVNEKNVKTDKIQRF